MPIASVIARRGAALAAVLSLVSLLQACDRPTGPTPAPAAGPRATLDFTELPPFDAANFVSRVTNPYFPLPPGTTYHLRSETDEGVEINTVEVTHDAKTILGVAATVVHDRVFLDGELTEDTFDWYAQDGDGNVWYLGEDTKELEDGKVVSTEGSWESGVDGATPGIIMWADPGAHVGETYRQEFRQGVAEDVAMVVGLDSPADVPFGHFTGCLETIDWSLIEDVPPAEREHKHYCPGIGVVLEAEGPADDLTTNELFAVTAPEGAPVVDHLSATVLPPGILTGEDNKPLSGVWLRVRLRDSEHDGPWDWTIGWGDGSRVDQPQDVQRKGEFAFLRSTAYTGPGPHTIIVTATDAQGRASVPALTVVR
jgi:hypothetical protein